MCACSFGTLLLCCPDHYGTCGAPSWLIKCREGNAAGIYYSMFALKGFTLDDPLGNLSTTMFQSLIWLHRLQQLTVTHSVVTEAGTLCCSCGLRHSLSSVTQSSAGAVVSHIVGCKLPARYVGTPALFQSHCFGTASMLYTSALFELLLSPETVVVMPITSCVDLLS